MKATPNPYVGLACPVCGEKVLQSQPATMHTDVKTGARTATHLACHDAVVGRLVRTFDAA